MSACCQCGKEVTNRNKHLFSTFKDKPICKKWKPCYYRRTGKSFRVRQPFPRGRIGGSIMAARKFNEIAANPNAIRQRIPPARPSTGQANKEVG